MNIILQKTEGIGKKESYDLLFAAKVLSRMYNLNFDKNKICYNQKQFNKVIRESLGNEVIIFDELEKPIPDFKKLKSLEQLECEYHENNFCKEIDDALLKQIDESKPKNTKLYGKTKPKGI